MTSARIGVVAAAFIAVVAWVGRRSREGRVICDVCFQPVVADTDMCPHCGTVFGAPDREYHEVDPVRWVTAQLQRSRSMTSDQLRTLSAAPQIFTFTADEGNFRGEVRAFAGDPASRTVRVAATLWAVSRTDPLASDELSLTLDE